MADRKPFLLRVDPALLEALQAWAADDLRSLNGQIEFLLRRALTDAKRLKRSGPAAEDADKQPEGGRQKSEGTVVSSPGTKRAGTKGRP